MADQAMAAARAVAQPEAGGLGWDWSNDGHWLFRANGRLNVCVSRVGTQIT